MPPAPASPKPDQFFFLQTWFGTRLALRSSDNRIVHAAPDAPHRHLPPVYAYVRDDHPGLCFLLPPLRVKGQVKLGTSCWLGQIKAFRIRATEEASVTLTDAQTGLYISAQPLQAGADCGELILDREHAREWEQFSLVAAEVAPAEVRMAAEALRPFLEWPLGAEGIAQALLGGARDYDALQAVGRLLRPFEVTALAHRLMTAPKAIANLASSAPNDVWAASALPDLLKWLSSDRQGHKFPRQLGRDCDIVHEAGGEYPLPSLAAECNAAARSLVAPRKDICILATMRDEGIYLLEWLAHHRMIGIETFFVYTNDNEDDSTLLLTALCRAGLIQLIDNPMIPGLRPQRKGYGHALQILPDILDYKWAAVVDGDEFIFLNEDKFLNIQDFLAWHEAFPSDSIGLSWRVHRSNGTIKFRPAPVTERFPTYCGVDQHIKSIFRPQRFVHCQCHFPQHADADERIFRAADGRELGIGALNPEPNYGYAWIGHFMLKSAEEYIVRRVRAQGDLPMTRGQLTGGLEDQFAERFITFFKEDEASNYAVSRDLAERTGEEVARLRALPGVASAEARCLKMFHRQSRQIRRRLGRNPAVRKGGTPESDLLAMLR